MQSSFGCGLVRMKCSLRSFSGATMTKWWYPCLEGRGWNNRKETDWPVGRKYKSICWISTLAYSAIDYSRSKLSCWRYVPEIINLKECSVQFADAFRVVYFQKFLRVWGWVHKNILSYLRRSLRTLLKDSSSGKFIIPRRSGISLLELAQIPERKTPNAVFTFREERSTMLFLVRFLFNKGNDEARSWKSSMICSFCFECQSVHFASFFLFIFVHLHIGSVQSFSSDWCISSVCCICSMWCNNLWRVSLGTSLFFFDLFW